MTNHQSRGRINCAPFAIRGIHGLLMSLPKTLEPLAYLYEIYPRVPYGVLVRVKSTGRLCEWTGCGLKNLEQRKASAALSWMQKRQDEGYDWRVIHTSQDNRDKPAAGGEGKRSAPEDT